MHRELQVSDFGEVRSLVQQGPSGWSALTLYLEQWGDVDSFDTLVMPYLRGHLDSWPARSYGAPRRWKRWMCSGHEVLAMRLLESLSLANIRRHGAGHHSKAFAPATWRLACLQHLHMLDLSNTGITRSDIKDLMGGAGRMKALETLFLNNSPRLFYSKALRDPFDSPRFPQIKRLALKSCSISSDSVERIARNDKLSGLEMLKISDNPLTDKGVRRICSSEQLAGLTSIDLNKVGMTHLGLKSLEQATFLPNLVWLSLSIGGDTVSVNNKLRNFLSHEELANLGSLTLSTTRHDDKLLEHIAMCPHLAGLNTLVLNRTYSPEALRTLPREQRLHALGAHRISSRGVHALLDSPYLSDQVKNAWRVFIEESVT